MENYKLLRAQNRINLLSSRATKDNGRIIAKIRRQMRKVEKK
jgi:hypothetical protein